jgi:hypothetical protein
MANTKPASSSQQTPKLAPSPRLDTHNASFSDNPPSSSQSRRGNLSIAEPKVTKTKIQMQAERSEMDRSGSEEARAGTSHSHATTRTNRSGSHGSRTLRAHGEVRTLPPWIDSVEIAEVGDGIDDDPYAKATDSLLRPAQAVPANHHYAASKSGGSGSGSPTLTRRKSKDGYMDTDDDSSTKPAEMRGLFGGPRDPAKGRKWDHAREGDPVIMSIQNPSSSPWSTFLASSRYGAPQDEEHEIVDPEFLEKQTPGYDAPWRGDVEGGDPEKALGLLSKKNRRKKGLVWYQRARRSILMHPLVPLAFRLTVLATSTIALGLSASIFHLTRPTVFAQSPSAVMAIVVDVIALPYIIYITWDEYTGKPLGLRPPAAKMRLVLLDLFFIIFESANLSLAFATITDRDGACEIGGVDQQGNFQSGSLVDPEGARMVADANICGQVKALAAILFVALLAWGLTFTVSMIRYVVFFTFYEERGRR